MEFPLRLEAGDEVDVAVYDAPLRFRANYPHMFPDADALAHHALRTWQGSYDGLTCLTTDAEIGQMPVENRVELRKALDADPRANQVIYPNENGTVTWQGLSSEERVALERSLQLRAVSPKD